jgi:hypothetical protein
VSTFTDWLRSHLQDYGQLVEKGSPLNNQYQQLRSNVSQNIPPTAAFHDSSQLAEWSQAAALNAPSIGVIKAWHGSPHKFTQFDDSAIGSGEGAQAFGMGHYSGEDVHALDSHYRKRLTENTSKINDWYKDPVSSPLINDLQTYHENRLTKVNAPDYPFMQHQVKNSVDDDIGKLYNIMNQNKGASFKDLKMPSYLEPVHDSLKKYIDRSDTGNKGFMYELNLKPDPEDLLHFDKEMKDHPKAVREKLNKAYASQFNGGGIPHYVTGEQVYKEFQRDLGDNTSYLLKRYGIPGHSFPGQGGKGQPNYVMYDPKNIEIKRRIKGGLDSPVKGFVDYIKGKKD